MAEQISFDVLARDRASRTFKDVGKEAKGAGDSIKGMAKDSELLSKQIEDVEGHLEDLRREFARTGDVSLKKVIQANERDLAFLQKIKKGLGEVVDEGGDLGRKTGKAFTSGLADTLGALPSQIKGAAIAGGVGVGLALAPLIGGTIGAAVLGGVGVGGIVGGIAAASQDDRVKQHATALSDRFMDGFAGAGQHFVVPLVHALDDLGDTADRFNTILNTGFRKLAPTVTALSRGVDGLVRNLGPGLDDAFEAAVPVVRALADELPEIGAALGDMFSAIAEEKDGAIMALSTISEIVQSQVVLVGNLTAGLSAAYEWIVRTGAEMEALIPEGLLATNIPLAAPLSEFFRQLEGDVNKAKSANDTFVGSLEEVANASDRAREANIAYADSIQDQFDPTANFISRLRDMKDAQVAYNDAVKEHGPKSREAKDANLAFAEAILRANSAAAAAEGTLANGLTPALIATFKAGGMTSAGLKDIGSQARWAQGELEDFQGIYTAVARIRTEFWDFRRGERELSRRASGGPVMAGKTYVVGEQGPEMVTFGDDGYVHNAAATRAMAQGGPAGGGQASGWGGSAAPTPAAAPTVINFPGFTGDPIADAVLARFRQDIQSFGGDRDAVVVYFGGQPA